jgi:acetyl esterase/lipase
MQLPLCYAEKAAVLDLMGHEPCPGVEIEFERELRAGIPDGETGGDAQARAPRADASDAQARAPRQWATIFRPATGDAQARAPRTDASDAQARAPRAAAPCLLCFHGGGFRMGDPNGNGAIAKVLALQLGVVTVSVSYRLGMPEAPCGTGILEDASHAWNWVQDNAEELGIDPARVAVEGQSAGCLLAGHLAVASPWIEFRNAARPAAFIAGWGPLDFVARWYDNGENNGAEDAIVGPGGHLRHPSLYHQLSALAHIVPGKSQLPPALFIYGRNDPVVHARQGRLGAAAWAAGGAYSEELYLPNIGHGIVGDNRPQREHWLAKTLAFCGAHWAGHGGFDASAG